MNIEDIRQQAIDDCRYAKSLSGIALSQHFVAWDDRYASELTKEDREYQLTILEIQRKLSTTECLLEN